MPELDNISPQPNRPRVLLAALLILCIVLIILLKMWGVILALLLIGFSALFIFFQPRNREAEALRLSIELSLQDIETTLAAFEHFKYSGDADAIADRTLHRPALLNIDSTNKDIEEFHYLESTSKRFINRVHAKLAGELSVGQLESLLSIADRRSDQLEQAWVAARRAALELGSE